MGTPKNELCRELGEYFYLKESLHQVTLTHDFEISIYETTQRNFLKVFGYNPSEYQSIDKQCIYKEGGGLPNFCQHHYCGDIQCDQHPVDKVTWHEAVNYCNALSREVGLDTCYECMGDGPEAECAEKLKYNNSIYDCPGYRLPTEAEWEYAYRAKSQTPFYPVSGVNGSITTCEENDPSADAIGWYVGNSDSRPHRVAQKMPNSWGLYDMAGNIAEWCHDWSQKDLTTQPARDPWGPKTGQARILRGGGYPATANVLRAGMRMHFSPFFGAAPVIGFRCARTLK